MAIYQVNMLLRCLELSVFGIYKFFLLTFVMSHVNLLNNNKFYKMLANYLALVKVMIIFPLHSYDNDSDISIGRLDWAVKCNTTNGLPIT